MRPTARARSWLPIFAALAALVVVLLLPDPAATEPPPSTPPVTAAHGRIVERLAIDDQMDPGVGPIGDLRVLLLDGPRAGETVEAFLQASTTEFDPTQYQVGDEVVVTFQGEPDGEVFVAVSERWRLPILGLLTIGFAAAVVVVARGRGLRALIALALTVALVLKVVVPQILAGAPPVPVAVAVAALVTVVTILLTEGRSRTSLAAIIGTIVALVLTGILSGLVSGIAQFTNAAASELTYLAIWMPTGFDLRGLLLAAFVLGALGVLDDVTVTQAAVVEELAHHSDLRGWELFSSALRIGRSHIAATVNTLFLAYVGAGLPLLVLFAVSDQPLILSLNSEIVAVEIVRTMVGSLGIVTAVPLTTAIAVWLIDRRVQSA